MGRPDPKEHHPGHRRVATTSSVRDHPSVWAIRFGYVHVGSRWQGVYRDKEPKSFWFAVVVFTMIVPVGIVGVAIWELGLWG